MHADGPDRRTIGTLDLPLVIDPGLEWSTFLGGSNREEIHGLALTRDGSGDVVVEGHTWSSDFPTAAAGRLGSSPLIPFVARLNASGTELVYATLFGSTNGNVSYAFDLTLDASSAPIVVGETNGADFPTTPGAYQPNFNEPSAAINRGWDGFVTRFNARKPIYARLERPMRIGRFLFEATATTADHPITSECATARRTMAQPVHLGTGSNP